MANEIRFPNEALNNAFNIFEITCRLVPTEKKLLENLKLIILGLVYSDARVIPCKKGNHELAFEFNRNDDENPCPMMKIAFGYKNLLVFCLDEDNENLIGELTLNTIEGSVMLDLISKLLAGKIIEKLTGK